MPAPYRVWFNKGFSVLEHIVSALSSDFTAIVSHSKSEALALEAAHEEFIEPSGLLGEAYLEFCLEQCRARQIEVFVPSKEAPRLEAARQRFEALGTSLLSVADEGTQRHLDRKLEFLRDFDPTIAPVAPFRVFSTLAEFEVAREELAQDGQVLCFKPSRGIYGHGFRILAERESLKRLLRGDRLHMSLEAARGTFARKEVFAPMLLMHHLAGVERSIDCLAHQGTLVQAVVRRKDSETQQTLEHHPAALEVARKLTERHALNGVFNVQLKDHLKGEEGVPYILEINARPSGGLYQAMASGLNFMDWALRLHLGLARPEDVPAPRTGLRLTTRSSVVVLGASENPEGALEPPVAALAQR